MDMPHISSAACEQARKCVEEESECFCDIEYGTQIDGPLQSCCVCYGGFVDLSAYAQQFDPPEGAVDDLMFMDSFGIGVIFK